MQKYCIVTNVGAISCLLSELTHGCGCSMHIEADACILQPPAWVNFVDINVGIGRFPKT